MVAATFAVPVIGLRLFEGGEIGVLGGIVGFLFYLCQYFVLRKGLVTVSPRGLHRT
jgi:hypothetical protein